MTWGIRKGNGNSGKDEGYVRLMSYKLKTMFFFTVKMVLVSFPNLMPSGYVVVLTDTLSYSAGEHSMHLTFKI